MNQAYIQQTSGAGAGQIQMYEVQAIEVEASGTNQTQQQQQQQQHENQSHIIEVTAGNNNQSSSSSTTIMLEDQSQQQQQQQQLERGDSVREQSLVDGPNVKIPNSYKYPLLKRYYEFGQWIGRNRKAVCLGCHLQTSSSQPDRLLKHLNRCSALSEADKVAVQDLMNERTANKRKKPTISLRIKKDNDDTTEYYGDEANTSNNDQAISNTISLPSGGLKKLRRDHPDKAGQIDEALTRFIMCCRIPLKSIHSPEFVEFCRSLNPDYRIPSRETITNVLIPGMLNII